MFAETCRCRREESGGEGRCADHDAIGPGRERCVDSVESPVAAADLQRHVLRDSCDAVEEAERRVPVEGAVEIDEVEASCSFGDEVTCERDGIASLDRDAGAHALVQPYCSSVEDVHRRHDLEAGALLTCYHDNMLACQQWLLRRTRRPHL